MPCLITCQLPKNVNKDLRQEIDTFQHDTLNF